MKNIQPLHLIFGGCGLAILGCVLPWATRSFEGSTGKVYNRQLGLESASGVITVLLAAAPIVLQFVKVPGKEKLMALVSLLCVCLVALIGVFSMIDIDSRTMYDIARFEDVKVAIGMGLYVVVLGGLVGGVGCFQRLQKIPGPVVPPSAPTAPPPSSPPPAP